MSDENTKEISAVNSNDGDSSKDIGESGQDTGGEKNLGKANDSIRASMQRQEAIFARKKAKKAERERAWHEKYG